MVLPLDLHNQCSGPLRIAGSAFRTRGPYRGWVRASPHAGAVETARHLIR
jgi:hypothetical protein